MKELGKTMRNFSENSQFSCKIWMWHLPIMSSFSSIFSTTLSRWLHYYNYYSKMWGFFGILLFFLSSSVMLYHLLELCIIKRESGHSSKTISPTGKTDRKISKTPTNLFANNRLSKVMFIIPNSYIQMDTVCSTVSFVLKKKTSQTRYFEHKWFLPNWKPPLFQVLWQNKAS